MREASVAALEFLHAPKRSIPALATPGHPPTPRKIRLKTLGDAVCARFGACVIKDAAGIFTAPCVIIGRNDAPYAGAAVAVSDPPAATDPPVANAAGPAADALKLQRPLDDGALKIVARGKKSDSGS